MKVDVFSKGKRSDIMASIRGKDTHPEMTVRRLLFRLGYRYRLHQKDLPGKPDIFMRRRNAALFVHGCFWHQHPKCRYATKPKSNRKFWLQKLKRNVERDKISLERLEALDIKVLTVWECEIRDISGLTEKLVGFLEGT